MIWLKWHNTTSNDETFRRIAENAGCTVRDVIPVWIYLLEIASDAEPRGSLEDFRPRRCAKALRWDIDSVESVVAAMTAEGLISDGYAVGLPGRTVFTRRKGGE